MTHCPPKLPIRRTGIGVALSLLLAACGGGGGGGAEPGTTTTLALQGVAATGAAIANGAVAVRCATGSGAATTNANGSFSVTVSGGSLPCMVKVTAADGSVLHSVAQGSGSSVTVNVSPLTELIVAQAAGGTAAGLYASFDAAAHAKVSAAALASAGAAVATALQSVVDLAGVDPIKDAIVAGSGAGLDGKLDTLAAKLAAASLTLTEVSAAIVANGSAAAAVIATQVQPAAATCASAHSGAYRLIDPNETADAYRLHKVTFDASTLTMSFADGSTATGAPVADQPCQFSADNGNTSLFVSPAGVFVQRYLSSDGSGPARLLIGIPEQTIALADLAGTWNSVEMGPTSAGASTYENGYAAITIDTAGAVTVGTSCDRLLACAPWTTPAGTPLTPGVFTVTADGGFTYTEGNGSGRFFVYRAPSGDLMMVGLGTDNNFIVASKQKALTLPTVATATPFWDMLVNNQGVASVPTDDIITVTAVDGAAGTYTRSRSSDGRVDTFAINNPRTGLRYRALNSCKTSAGATQNCLGLIMMQLQGMGMAVYGSSVAGTEVFGVSVNKPRLPTTAVSGTLVVTGGESYPLRVSLTIDAAGQINGGEYDFHKLDGTMTPCEHSAANDATCHGASSTFGTVSQAGPLTLAGSTGTIALSTAPDQYGFAYTGTISGATWSGTWTQLAPGTSTVTGSGTFSVAVVISQAG